MTRYNFGDIVLIGFPHTDLQGISKRPAIVLYDSCDQDVLLARITTQEYLTETDYKIPDWQKSGLLAESYVRLGKQATRKTVYYEEVRSIRGKRYRSTQVNAKKNIPPVILSILKIEKDFVTESSGVTLKKLGIV